MKIIIIGAGLIGRNLAKSLSDENTEVYLIESNGDIVRKVSDKLDVKVVVGNGADPDVLKKAHAEEADLVLAVTTSDETNLVVCSLAATLGAKRRIARVRNTSLGEMMIDSGYEQFKINEIINPELLAAQAIVKTIQTPGASEVADFAEGKILLRSFDIKENSLLCGMKIAELRDEDFPWPFLIVALVRDDEVTIPSGDTVISTKDHIYVLLPAASLGEFLTFVDPDIKMPKKIIIYGASMTGIHVAKELSTKIREIILIEENTDLAKEVAGELSSTTIINGAASEADILIESGIEAADAFIAASNNDHANLISSVLAKKMGAKTTIITTQQPEYMTIVNDLDIDAIINPHFLAVEQILHMVRGKGIRSVTKLLEGEAEALEFVPEEGAAVTKDFLKNIKLPKNSIVGAVYRGDDIELADGDTMIEPGEKVIVFCHESAIKKLQTMFTN